MAGNLNLDMAQAFAYMSKSSVLNRLYAVKLKRNGWSLHSKLLSAIARAEKIHARRALMYIRGKIGDTAEYLDGILKCKHQDATKKYPQLSERLNEQGKKKAAEAFGQFSEVANVHLKLLNDVLEKRSHDSTNYYVCQICGNIAINDPPLNCPVCHAIKEKFRLEV